jgi:hypothetical protein
MPNYVQRESAGSHPVHVFSLKQGVNQYIVMIWINTGGKGEHPVKQNKGKDKNQND